MNTELNFLNPRRLAATILPGTDAPREYKVCNEGTETPLTQPAVVLAYADPSSTSDSMTFLKDADGDGSIGLADIEASVALLKELTAGNKAVTGQELAAKGFRPAVIHPGTTEQIARPQLGMFGEAANDFVAYLKQFPTVKVGSATADADGNPVLRFKNASGSDVELSELKGFGETIRATVTPLAPPTPPAAAPHQDTLKEHGLIALSDGRFVRVNPWNGMPIETIGTARHTVVKTHTRPPFVSNFGRLF